MTGSAGEIQNLVNNNNPAEAIQNMEDSSTHTSRHAISDADREFLTAFHNRTLDRFSHLDHLRLAWIVMRGHDLVSGLGTIREGIKEFAIYQNAQNRYHETLTTFWARIVYHAIQARPDIQNFDQFIASFPMLLNRDLPLRHWKKETLWSNTARESWLGPDLSTIPD